MFLELETIKGEKTFFWSGKYHININKRDTLDTQLNVLENFDPKVPDNWSTSKIVVLGNLHPAVQGAVLDQLEKKPEAIILDTMNFWMDNFRSTLDEVIARVDIIVINDEEALQLSAKESLFIAANILHTMGPKYVIIKKGEHGALLFSGECFSAQQCRLRKSWTLQGLEIVLLEDLQVFLLNIQTHPLKA